MSAKSAQVLVVGAGPGGYVCAIKLAKLGKKVLLVDKDKLGGECLNYGCIPSKALIHAAGLGHKVKKAAAIGVAAPGLSVDWSRVVGWKAGVLAGLNRGIGALLKGNGVEHLAGEARFTGPREASVGPETVRFESAVIVTGSRPIALPSLPVDGSRVITSKEALELTEAPARLLVVGGGVIGLEIGMFFAKLGSKVTVVEMTGQLLPGVEADLLAPVTRSLSSLGVEVLLNSKVLDAGGRVQTPEGERTVEADRILLSVGRSPNTRGLGLEAAGVGVDPKGFIPVNDRYQTSAPHIYAAGDVVGPPYLAHKASREGMLVAAAIAGRHVEPRGPVPSAIFTDPEIAFVGETAAEAEKRGLQVRSGRFPFSALGRAQTTRETEGFVKIVAEQGSGLILGVSIVGPGASDLIGEACLALRMKATLEDAANTVHPHPTLCEAFAEAAEAVQGQAIHLAPVRR